MIIYLNLIVLTENKNKKKTNSESHTQSHMKLNT